MANEEAAPAPSTTVAVAVAVSVDPVPLDDADTERQQEDQKRSVIAAAVVDEDEREATVSRSHESRSEQKTIVRNMIVVCVSFFLNVTAFAGILNLQSSINFEGNVGQTSLAILYIGPAVSNLLVSTYVIRKWGFKWVMVVSMLLATAYLVASFHSLAVTQHVGAIVTGLAAGVLWSAHGNYLTTLGRTYAALGNQTPQSIIGRFFGIFFMGHRLATTAGGLVSSLVFQKPDHVVHLPSDIVSRICGSAYCYQDLREVATRWTNRSSAGHTLYEAKVINDTVTATITSSIYRPSLLQMYSLYGIYIGCALLAPVLIMIFLKPLRAEVESFDHDHEQKHGKVHMWSNLVATFKCLTDVKMLLLTPITILHGASIAFITADYGVSFTSCTLGIDSVGYVIAVFGLTSGLTSLCSGLLLKYTGRQAIFFFGAACCMSTIAAMYRWIPNTDQPEMLYLFAGLWGVCTTVWTSQLISFIGLILNNESAAPMACYYTLLNMSTGSWFIIGRSLCIYSQLHLLMLLLFVGMIGYSIVEVLVRKERSSASNDAEGTTTTTKPTEEGTDDVVVC